MSKTTALVLAGKRDGTLDPLAAADGVSHKCLIKVAGRTRILYPITSLASSKAIGRIIVSIDDPAVLEGIPEIVGSYKKAKMTSTELAESKLRLLNDHKTMTELPQDRLRMLGWFYANGFPPNLNERFPKDLSKVTLKNVN